MNYYYFGEYYEVVIDLRVYVVLGLLNLKKKGNND